ncbi:hypothetical protein M9435_001791 [Picochlorum sp. BPE23]|nr:hypothetical protein M9435_001791 [Picochlorum sp. BPE23]
MVKKRDREYENSLYSRGDGAVGQGLTNVLWGRRRKKEKLGEGDMMGHGQQGVTMTRVGRRRSRDEWDGILYSDDDDRAKRLMTAAFPGGADMTSATTVDDEGRSREDPHMYTTSKDNDSNNNNDASMSGIGTGSDVLKKDGVGAIKVHLPPGYHHHRHDWYPRDMITVPNPSQSIRTDERLENASRDEEYMAPHCMAIVPYVGGPSLVTKSHIEDEENQGNVCPTGDAMTMDVDS